MLLCLHEEHTVAIAHGYAKVLDRPMAAAVHANVGLQHAVMAIYNAYAVRACARFTKAHLATGSAIAYRCSSSVPVDPLTPRSAARGSIGWCAPVTPA
jgi:hypothetical protein